MVRALDKADAMLTLSSALQYREPFTILPFTVWFHLTLNSAVLSERIDYKVAVLTLHGSAPRYT